MTILTTLPADSVHPPPPPPAVLGDTPVLEPLDSSAEASKQTAASDTQTAATKTTKAAQDAQLSVLPTTAKAQEAQETAAVIRSAATNHSETAEAGLEQPSQQAQHASTAFAAPPVEQVLQTSSRQPTQDAASASATHQTIPAARERQQQDFHSPVLQHHSAQDQEAYRRQQQQQQQQQQQDQWQYYCYQVQQQQQMLHQDQLHDYRRYQQYVGTNAAAPGVGFYNKRAWQASPLDQRGNQQGLSLWAYDNVSTTYDGYPLASREAAGAGHESGQPPHMLPQPYSHGGMMQTPMGHFQPLYLPSQPDPRDYVGLNHHYGRAAPPDSSSSSKVLTHASQSMRSPSSGAFPRHDFTNLPTPGLPRQRSKLSNSTTFANLGLVPTPTPMYTMAAPTLTGSSSSTPAPRTKVSFEHFDVSSRERMDAASPASAPGWLGHQQSSSMGNDAVHPHHHPHHHHHPGEEGNSTHVDPTTLCFTPPVKAPAASKSPSPPDDPSPKEGAESPVSTHSQMRYAQHSAAQMRGSFEQRQHEGNASAREVRGEDDLSSGNSVPDDNDNDSDYDPRAGSASARKRKSIRQSTRHNLNGHDTPRRGRMPVNEKEHMLLNPADQYERFVHDGMHVLPSQSHGAYLGPPAGMLMGHGPYRFQPHHYQQPPAMQPSQPPSMGASQPSQGHQQQSQQQSLQQQPSQQDPDYSDDDEHSHGSRQRPKKRKRKAPSAPAQPIVKAFQCDVKGCEKRFRRSEHLKRHIRSLHTGEKPYPCSTCGKTFSRTDNLTQHMRVHSPDSRHLEQKRRRKMRPEL